VVGDKTISGKVVSFKGVGCEPLLNLAASPDEAGSIICTVVDKLYLQLLRAVDVYELYY
jgi:hypothetical protein